MAEARKRKEEFRAATERGIPPPKKQKKVVNKELPTNKQI
jgi:hypothetical protein